MLLWNSATANWSTWAKRSAFAAKTFAQKLEAPQSSLDGANSKFTVPSQLRSFAAVRGARSSQGSRGPRGPSIGRPFAVVVNQRQW